MAAAGAAPATAAACLSHVFLKLGGICAAWFPQNAAMNQGWA